MKLSALIAAAICAGSLAAQTPVGRLKPQAICVDCPPDILISRVSGEGKTGTPLTKLPTPLTVKLTWISTSIFGNAGDPIPTFPFNFAITSTPLNANGAELVYKSNTQESINVLTESDGTASVNLILGDVPGDYQVTASCFGCIGATFTETAAAFTLAIRPGSIGGDQQTGNVGSSGLNPLVVETKKPDGSPAGNIALSFAITSQPQGATGASMSVSATTTSADGTGSSQITLGDQPGQYEVTASCPVCVPSSVQFTEQAVQVMVTLLDPIPSATCPTPCLFAGAAITTVPATLLSAGGIVKGTAADGVSTLVVRITGVLANEHLQLSLDEDGELAEIEPSTLGPQVRIQADSSGNAFALYRAPVDFARGGGIDDMAISRIVTLSLQSLDNLGVTSKNQIIIVRPPVILVHGNWSNAQRDWEFFQLAESPLPFQTFQADYSAFLDRGVLLSAGVVLSYVGDTIAAFRQGAITSDGSTIPVAAIQADLVGYSLGGLVSRGLVTRRFYTNNLNYNAGYIHKLITLDTPHLGSELATALLASSGSCQTLFSTFVGPVGQNITDMKPGSSLLKMLNTSNPLFKHIPTAVIAATSLVSQADAATAKFFGSALYQIGALSGPCRSLLPTGGFQALFGSTPFPGGSDLIVSTYSQLASGLGIGGSVPAVLFTGYIHAVNPRLFPLGPDVRQSTLDLGSGARVEVPAPFPATEQVLRFLNTPVSAFTPITP
jgi:hypothetical protein